MNKQENKKQAWENCAYAVGAGVESDIILMMLPSSQALCEDMFFEAYACENEQVRKLGKHPISYAEMHYMPHEYKPQEVAVLCKLVGYNKKTINEEDKKRFRNEVEIGTAVCKDCKFYEPRGNELHPKSEVERTKKLTDALKANIHN